MLRAWSGSREWGRLGPLELLLILLGALLGFLLPGQVGS